MKTSFIVTHLRKLGDVYFKKSETHKANIFNTAATNILAVYPDEFPSDLKFLTNIKGIGPSTINEIKECIETGTSKRLLELESSLVEKQADNEESLNILKQLLKQNKSDDNIEK